jgi:integrase
MPKAVKLTKRTVDATKAPRSGETFVWDAQVPGFGLRVYASGRRVFLYQYRISGRSRRMVLGGSPSITVDHARDLAIAAAAKVADGTDPQGNDSDALQDKTFADVFPEYLAERRGKLAARTVSEYERLWEKTLAPTFGAKRVAILSETAVAQWHSARATTPTLANRAVDLLSSLCAWAERRGYRAKHSNPCSDVERFDEVRRSRSLTVDEYRRLGAALTTAQDVGVPAAKALQKKSRGMSAARRAKLSGKKRGPYATRETAAPTPANPVTIAALRFLTLSGWRESEALTLRWDAVNFERGVAVLTDTKSGRSERVLGTAALDVLRTQQRVADTPYVFVGERAGSHLAEPKHVWQAVKQAAALETTAPLRLHDLRHSFTTVARDEAGLGDHVIARLVGHTLSGMTSRYGEVRDATVRNAANTIAQTISSYLSSTEAKVLPFAAHRIG